MRREEGVVGRRRERVLMPTLEVEGNDPAIDLGGFREVFDMPLNVG